MGWSAVYAIGAAVSAGAAVDNANNQRAQAREAADAQRFAAAAEAQANQQAEAQAIRREQTADQIRQAEEQATAQLDDTPQVLATGTESTLQRKRRVQASFGVGAGGASGAGSISL